MENTLGFNATKEEVLRIWEENAKRWHVSGSPWRPSAGDIELYNKLGGEKLKGNVLVLGATPELRDLVARYGGHITLIDISSAMIERMTSLLTYSDPRNEIWVKCDWSETPFLDSYFDLVIGDMPWWVLSVAKQHEVRDAIARVLKSDGILITRIRMRGSERTKDDAAKIIRRYLDELEQNPSASKSIRNAMISYLQDITADAEARRINRAETKEVLLHTAASIDNPVHKEFVAEAVLHVSDTDWTSQTRDELLKIIEKKFLLVKEAKAADYDAEYYPIIAFNKKND